MPTASEWIPVVAATEVTTAPWACHDVAGTPVRLIRTPDGAILAIGAWCPHMDNPLDRAEVEGDQVLCPRHWYAYDRGTGRNVHPGWERDDALPVYDVRVVDGIVEVALRSDT